MADWFEIISINVCVYYISVVWLTVVTLPILYICSIQVNLLTLTPLPVAQMVKYKDVCQHDISSIERIISGTAPQSEAMYNKFREIYKVEDFVQGRLLHMYILHIVTTHLAQVMSRYNFLIWLSQWVILFNVWPNITISQSVMYIHGGSASDLANVQADSKLT